MGTRQYIGARYVPKFADPIAWNNQKSYEALEIVTYLGGSYTSKKPVPVGVDISNTEYWVNTGNYNAQVEEYRELAENTAVIANRLAKDKYIIIGDSYGVVSGDRTVTWATQIEEFLGLTVAHDASEVTDETDCFEMCVNGGGFIGHEYSGGDWLSQLQTLYPENYDKNSVTKIIIAGGLNDRSETQTTIENAISVFRNYCDLNFPNAMVYLFPMGFNLISSSSVPQMSKVNTAYSSCRKYKNWVFCTAARGIFHNPYFVNHTDYTHPTNNGGIQAARIIKNAIYGHENPLETRSTLILHQAEDESDYTVTELHEETPELQSGVNGNDVYTFFTRDITLVFSEPQSLMESKEIGTIENCYYCTFDSYHAGVATMIGYTSENEYVIVPIRMRISYDGKVMLSVTSSASDYEYKRIVFPFANKFVQSLII